MERSHPLAAIVPKYSLVLCFSNCFPRTTGGPRRFRKKNIAKIVSDTKRMQNTPTHVCAKTALVTVTVGIILLLFTGMHFWVRGIARNMGDTRLPEV
jgi:hypothetical protein